MLSFLRKDLDSAAAIPSSSKAKGSSAGRFYDPFASPVAVGKGVITRTQLMPNGSILVTTSGTENMLPEAMTELFT